jgi:outer membrane immunogenic protein
MKFRVGFVAISALIALPAMAADLAVKAPLLAPAPADSWTGFYVGGNVGGAWTSTSGTVTPIIEAPVIQPVTGSFGASAAIGGFQEGINWQFAPKWVVGFEGDWSFTNASANISQGLMRVGGPPIPGTLGIIGEKLDWVASARNRLGYLVAPNLMVFGTGGLALGKIDYSGATSINNAGATYASTVASNHISGGWVAGAGLEWMWGGHWLLRGEYLYYHLSSGQTATSNNPYTVGGGIICLPSCPTAATTGYSWNSMNVNELRAALSYKF